MCRATELKTAYFLPLLHYGSFLHEGVTAHDLSHPHLNHSHSADGWMMRVDDEDVACG
jgi:hypothetical protein